MIALLAGYGISKGMNNSAAELEGTALANLEALADGESGGIPTFPCTPSSGSSCEFLAKDASGQYGTAVILGYRYKAL
ncbi:MAG: NVEALA domain-containing protein [Capnocytophaga sp.]|nr:NVEALA domain-containing protein [Capnocytophaga sp.]